MTIKFRRMLRLALLTMSAVLATVAFTPAPASALTQTWVRIGGGNYHTCAIRTDGTLWCWGANWWGQLGVGDTTSHNVPVQVTTRTDWVDVSSGGWSHTCAVTSG